jgi:tRNA threonylcarbamoyladenosine biosynthesis protein TsaE
MTEMERVFDLPDEAAQRALGMRLGARCRAPLRVYLHGALGAGKTTLVRAALGAMGHAGPVRSPTYTLIEPYDTPAGAVCHIDLYRVRGAGDLDSLGLREYLDGPWCCFVEWPEHGADVLPAPDVAFEIAAAAPGRRITARAGTPAGAAVLEAL